MRHRGKRRFCPQNKTASRLKNGYCFEKMFNSFVKYGTKVNLFFELQNQVNFLYVFFV
jgi:hypothetical protein